MDATFIIAGVTIPVFGFAFACGAILSVGIALYRTGWRIGTVVDLAIGTGIGAVVGGRIEHVLVHWDYFGRRTDEITRLSLGGLEWHGALIGGLIGLAVIQMAKNRTQRRRGAKTQSFGELLSATAPALPLLAFMGWLGCYAAPCAWGKEVTTLADYPSWAVGWTRDVFNIYAPRYHTQLYGMALAAVLFVVAWIPVRRNAIRAGEGQPHAQSLSITGRRFWLVLALLSVGMFFIGFWRADVVPMLFGLRADQVLDAVLAGVSVGVMIMMRSTNERG